MNHSPDSLPPEGAWISPSGEVIPAVEHVGALRSEPERFGLSSRDVQGASLVELKRIAVEVIRRGWIRFRYLDGLYRFEVGQFDDRARSVMSRILGDCVALAEERISVSVVDRLAEYESEVGRFLSGDGSG